MRLVGDVDVSGHSHLSAEHAPLSHLRASGDARLCGDDGVLANLNVVGHLDEVVEFHTLADDGAAHCGAVDASVGADFHIVFDDNIADLRNLVVSVGGGCESESVGTNHASGMNGHAVAKLATLVDGHMGIDAAVVANDHAVADVGKRGDVAILSDGCRRRNECQRVDTRFLGPHRVVELEQLGHALISVLHADERCGDGMFQFHLLVDKHNRRFCVVDEVGVFGIGEERDGSWCSFLDFCKSMHGGVLIAFDAALYELGYLFSCKLHVAYQFFYSKCKYTHFYLNTLITEVIFANFYG